jgi:hypothetical protein
VAVLFVATQYEIPFKLSISTFHVSVMPSTPAIASHNVRHPSPSRFPDEKVSCRDPERGCGGWGLSPRSHFCNSKLLSNDEVEYRALAT